jgi:hypothetical protein
MKDKKFTIKSGKLSPRKDDLRWQDDERQAYQRWLDSLPEPPSPDKQQAVLAMFDDAMQAARESDAANKRFSDTYHQSFKLAKRAGWTPSPSFNEMALMATEGMILRKAKEEFTAFCRGELHVKPKSDEWNGWL